MDITGNDLRYVRLSARLDCSCVGAMRSIPLNIAQDAAHG